jgi:spore germination protein
VAEDAPVPEEQPAPAFREIWAYLMRGEEKELLGSEPLTDVCWFSAGLTRMGRITEKIARPTLKTGAGSPPAIHLVVAELSNPALLHFALDARYGVRPLLIDDICRVAEPFDGVQIDFESMAKDDADSFVAFLGELRARLPSSKKLSVALPARMTAIADAYEYTRIAPLVDRMIIMAYDEHWSTSAPGPVASLPWCAKVVDFARSVVDPAKLVMGLPLYGRAWQDKRLARALRFSHVQDLVAEKGRETSYSAEKGSTFEYTESVVVTVYFEDLRSLLEKLRLYESRAVGAVSFWRIGQGPPRLWGTLAVATGEGPSPDTAAEPASRPAHGGS